MDVGKFYHNLMERHTVLVSVRVFFGDHVDGGGSCQLGFIFGFGFNNGTVVVFIRKVFHDDNGIVGTAFLTYNGFFATIYDKVAAGVTGTFTHVESYVRGNGGKDTLFGLNHDWKIA